MKFYEIIVYHNEEGMAPQLRQYLKSVIEQEELVTIKKEWEKGYHLKLVGIMPEEQAITIYETLHTLVEKYPSPHYDAEAFVCKYDKVARFYSKTITVEDIVQNTVRMKEVPDLFGFQNREQLELYLRLHHTFDRYYAKHYWKRDIDIVQITRDIFFFFQSLPDKKLFNSGELLSNGYISHLSHYLGFLHSLGRKQQEQISATFEKRATADFPLVVQQTIKNVLIKGLEEHTATLHSLVDAGYVNFYSPKREEDFLQIAHSSSARHQAIYRDEHKKRLIKTDKVAITNRWILNVLYEKLVVLDIKPIDKFYMNYLFSTIRFTQKQIGGVV